MTELEKWSKDYVGDPIITNCDPAWTYAFMAGAHRMRDEIVSYLTKNPKAKPEDLIKVGEAHINILK